MSNKVEILRAICFTKENIKNIKNLGDEITELDIDLMESFKKIYELGENQLKKFLNLLYENKSNVDLETAHYYVDLLLSGPLSNMTMKHAKDLTFFSICNDSMGFMGDKFRSAQSISIIPNVDISKSDNFSISRKDISNGVSKSIERKLPFFLYDTIDKSNFITEEVFKRGMKSSFLNDNTLPLINKNSEERIKEEPEGKIQQRPIGNYIVKDSSNFINVINIISPKIFKNVEDNLNEKDYEFTYQYQKFLNPFIDYSLSDNFIIEKIVKEGNEEHIIMEDLLGDVFEDSERKKDVLLKVDTPEKSKEYTLYSNNGQLGN